MDIVTRERRSKNMAAIKSKDTSAEKFVRSALFARGYRYTIHDIRVTGQPDIFFPRKKAAIFIHGCYWHRHDNCTYAYTPKTNVEFWLTKFRNNRQRDTVVRHTLLESGIRVLVIWECTIRKMRRSSDFCNIQMSQIESFIRTPEQQFLQI